MSAGERLAGVPLLADVRGRRVVLVGAGPVAAAKIPSFIHAEATVTVIAPDAVEDIVAAARAGDIRWERRPYRRGDLAGAFLVVAATGTLHVNDTVMAEAEAQQTLCIRTDGGGSAALLAAVRRGDFLIAVSTGGHAPALAAAVRGELERRYGSEYGVLTELLGDLRRDPAVAASLAALTPRQRRAAWRSILDTDILDLLRSSRLDTAREVASSCLSSFSV